MTDRPAPVEVKHFPVGDEPGYLIRYGEPCPHCRLDGSGVHTFLITEKQAVELVERLSYLIDESKAREG